VLSPWISWWGLDKPTNSVGKYWSLKRLETCGR